MKILVLAGSPKGSLSFTLQYVLLLQKRFPEVEFQIVHVCQQVQKFETDEAVFGQFLDDVRGADAVFWAYPVYSFLVHAYVKRFIELIVERDAAAAFHGKYAAIITTSIHFFDHTSHNYVHAISEDFGMKYFGAYSADVYEMLEEDKKQRLVFFFRDFLQTVEGRAPLARVHDPVHPSESRYAPSSPRRGDVELGDKRAVILTDVADLDSNLGRMIERLRSRYSADVEVVNLNQIAIRSGCDGCFQCGADGLCVYREKDDIEKLYLSTLASADILVLAGEIRERYLSSRWKLFFDRGFFRPLVPLWPGKQMACLVSGPLKQLPNLRQILEGYIEYHQGSLVGIVTDESEESSEIDDLLDCLAGRLALHARQGYAKPRTFLGVGGSKIFRDETFAMLRPVFQVAHHYFRKNGMYDFPQKNYKYRMMAVGGMLLTKIPWMRKQFFSSLKTQMVRSLQKELEKE